MSTHKRPAAAACTAPLKKRLRGKQEAPGYNENLPEKFLTWRAQRIYTAYKALGGAQPRKDLTNSLALAEPNPTHYAEYMGIYLGGCLAVEGKPQIACLGLLVDEWAAELTVAEWRAQPAKSLFCKGFDGVLCRFNTKKVGRPSWGARGAQNCLLCSEALMKQGQTSPQGRGILARVLKALRARGSNSDIFEAACDRVASWLGLEAADALRAKAAAPKRSKPRQNRAAAQEERLTTARASFGHAMAKRKTIGPAPSHSAWKAYRAKAVAEQRLGKKKFYPKATRRQRLARAEIDAGVEVDNSPDLPKASWSPDSIALQKWCVRGAWGMCPDCNILQSRPLTSASFKVEEHAATIRPSDCKTCKRSLRKHYVPQPCDVPEPLQGLSASAVSALRLLDYDLGPERSMSA